MYAVGLLSTVNSHGLDLDIEDDCICSTLDHTMAKRTPLFTIPLWSYRLISELPSIQLMALRHSCRTPGTSAHSGMDSAIGS